MFVVQEELDDNEENYGYDEHDKKDDEKKEKKEKKKENQQGEEISFMSRIKQEHGISEEETKRKGKIPHSLLYFI